VALVPRELGRPPTEAPNMEKTAFDDQKIAARFERVRAQVLAHPALFANQGFVAATWRTYRGRRLGPYFRVSYRESGRQRSIYLGRSEELADRVRRLLADVQRRRRKRRLFAKLEAEVRASLRRHKARFKEYLAQWDIRLKGWEFRGARQGLARYVASRSRSMELVEKGLMGAQVCHCLLASSASAAASGMHRLQASSGTRSSAPIDRRSPKPNGTCAQSGSGLRDPCRAFCTTT
jgi:hypothetical protein